MDSIFEASIVIVVRNDPRIVNCLQSVLSQDIPREAYEIIVVDNDSEDDTPTLIKQFPVKLFTEKRVGMCWARNFGIEMAQGKIVAFTDADCVVSRTWLSDLLAEFDSSEVGGVGGSIVKLEESTDISQSARDLVIGQQRTPQFLPMFSAPYIVTANAAYRLDILRKIGGFDPQFFSGGDVDIAWQVQLAGYKIKLAPEGLVCHASRTTWNAYFRQFYKYGLGHVLLFKKYRQYTKRRFLVNSYPFVQIIRLFLLRIPATFLATIRCRCTRLIWLRLGLDLTEYVALICGDVVGALRYHVPYI